jgi:thymidylate synthase ThyX
VLREYEHVDMVYELVVSASCYAQLKRHRMLTLTPQPYDAALGITVPDSFDQVGLTVLFRDLADRSADCAARIERLAPEAAPYALTNAHRRRVLVKLNAREIFHFARLREDAHAQWDIRRTAARMLEEARPRMPLTLLLATGKDRFGEARESLLGG